MKRRLTILGLLSTLGFSSALAQDVGICGGVAECVMDLRDAMDAFAEGLDHFIAHAAAEAALRMDSAHDAAIEATGLGLYYGAQRSPLDSWEGLTPQDCTTFVVTVLKAAFDAADLSDEIRSAISDAASLGSGGLEGVDLMQELQERFDWEGVYWNPDVSHPSDGSDEHPYSAYLAAKGSYYGIEVDPDNAVVDYRPSWKSGTEADVSGIEALELLPFGVLAARGGRHMAVVIYGQVYEVHWLASASSDDVITSIPLAEWDWLSGAIVYPPGTWPSDEAIEQAQQAAAAEAAEAAAGDEESAD